MKKLFLVFSDPLVFRQHLFPIAEQLSKYYQLYLISNFEQDQLIEFNYIKYEKLGLKITRKPSLLLDIKTIISLASYNDMYKPNMIVSFTPKGGFVAAWIKLYNKIKRRKIVYIHYFTGLLWVDEKNTKLKNLILKICDVSIIKMADRCFADSRAQCKLISEKLKCKKETVRCIGEGSLRGVDTKKFYKNTKESDLLIKRLGLMDKNKIILFLGRVCESKGIEMIIGLAKKCRNMEKDWVFLLVGPVEDLKIKEEIDRLGNIKRIDFTDKPEEYINISKLLILPSKREGFGSVVIEAAACGVPTIGADIDGLRESIKHNHTGVLCKDSISEYHKAIYYLLNDADKYKDLSINCIKMVNQSYKATIVIRNLVEEINRAARIKC